MTTEPARRRFNVGEYYEMARIGILGEDDRVELIEGEIVDMSPIGRRHAACVDRLNRLFSQLIGDSAIVRIQGPVRLSELTEPQPDVALLHPRPDFYAARDPQPEDVFLVVEVAETSAHYDRLVKMPLYAASGIPEVWLVDLKDEAVMVYRQPGREGYGMTQMVRRGERLSPEALPQVELAVDDVLGS